MRVTDSHRRPPTSWPILCRRSDLAELTRPGPTRSIPAVSVGGLVGHASFGWFSLAIFPLASSEET